MLHTLHHAFWCVFVMTTKCARVFACNITEVMSALAKIAIFCFILDTKSHQSLESPPSQPQRCLRNRHSSLGRMSLLAWLGVGLLPVALANCAIQPDANGIVIIPANLTAIGAYAFEFCS